MPKVALKAVEMLRAEPIRRVEPRLGGVTKEREQVVKKKGIWNEPSRKVFEEL